MCFQFYRSVTKGFIPRRECFASTMTEITLPKKSFLATLDALQTQYQLSTTVVHFETEPAGDRFMLAAKRGIEPVVGPVGYDAPVQQAPEVRAFGPCQVVGDPVSVDFDLKELQTAILKVHSDPKEESVTLVVSAGVSVKPLPTSSN